MCLKLHSNIDSIPVNEPKHGVMMERMMTHLPVHDHYLESPSRTKTPYYYANT